MFSPKEFTILTESGKFLILIVVSYPLNTVAHPEKMISMNRSNTICVFIMVLLDDGFYVMPNGLELTCIAICPIDVGQAGVPERWTMFLILKSTFVS